MNTYNEYYRENIIPNLMEQLKLKSPMEVPKLLKITLVEKNNGNFMTIYSRR